MKKIASLIFLLNLTLLAFAQSADKMQVKITGNGFEKRTFEKGTAFFTNRDYALKNVPKAFRGFEFLANKGKVSEEGVIIPSRSGVIYIIAPANTKIDGWIIVENSEFSYEDQSNSVLSIYQKLVNAGQEVEIPVVNKYAGVTPIAKQIEYEAPATSVKENTVNDSNSGIKGDLCDMMQVKVDGNSFEKRTFENGTPIFINRKYALKNVPKNFQGFEFLASQGGVPEEGVIIPSKNGIIYIVAPAGMKIKGWSVVDNSTFTYDDSKNTPLSIYQKTVTAGQKIEIPIVSKYPGVTPLAKTIEYGSPTVFVKGKLIDIAVANPNSMVFPQNSSFKFRGDLPASIKGKQYAVSLIENQGVNQVRSSSSTEIVIGLHYKTLKDKNWKYTGDSVAISSTRNYYIYTCEYNTPNEWLGIPQPLTKGTVAPTLVFNDKLKVANPLKVPGTVITRTQDIKNMYITNPSIVILPDGRYLASCAGALRNKGDRGGASFFISSDKGKTWQVQSGNSVIMAFCSLFVHNGELYLMGTNRGYKDVAISKSIDNGKTWTTPIDASNGLLLTGGFYHSAPVPVVIQNGRIWRAMENCEDSKGKNKRALVMSAPVDADLLNASSWTTTNELTFNVSDKLKENHDFKQWLEGNVVVDKNGNVVDLLRVDEWKEGGYAAITHVSGIDKLSYDPEKDLIRLPGGGKKFTIRFDSLSNKYWTISNAEFDEDRVKTHSGKYKTGVHAGLLRNRVVLMYSDDLKNWNVKDTLISADNPFFYGFQYTDWQFDGNDIIAVTRTAFEEERGLPMRQHDANFFTFYRYKDFRTTKIQTLKPVENN